MDMKINIGFTILFVLIIYCLYKFKIQLEILECQTENLSKKIEDLEIEEEETVEISKKEEELLVDANKVIDEAALKQD